MGGDHMSEDATSLSITRIVNACILLEIGGDAVLTDPYFDDHWFMRLREPIGLKASDLPRLTAVLGGHGVFDHWQPGSLGAYAFKKSTPLFVATAAMRKKALNAGFPDVEVVEWSERRKLSAQLTLEVAPAQRVMGAKVNSYVLQSKGTRIYVGTEARDIEPLARYRAAHGPVDVALLPIDGSCFAGHRLVMSAADAIEGARVLGARVLVPIHFALKPVPLLLQIRSSIADLKRLSANARGLTVTPLETGKRWIFTGATASSVRQWG
jgi:L-ascorbate metabolism protein UlaG (beta-lactamase superfamily)